MIDLTVIWALIIAFAVLMYVVMDGFDLGIGILFPTFAPGQERDQAMNAIAPVWDGNETWLVLGGGGLFAAFPLAYAIILPATYPLIIAMLLGLVFRGVAFEFRWRDPRHRAFWDMAFFAGSLVAALAQGITLGALLQGIHVEGRAYAGGWLDWLSPYSLLTGVGVVAGYALLGSTWLAVKVEGSAEDKAYAHARRAAWATLALMAAVSLATPFLAGQYFQRWFTQPMIYWLAPVPLVTGAVAFALMRSLGARHTWRPFLLSLALFLLGMIGLGVSIWPWVVPQSISIWQAAAPHRSQVFMLVGVLAIMPLILGYTAWAYWVFRGKVGTHGYH
ncbi:cytochrome bd quinol oxidase subunit 2 apoprotein [Novosphingobium aromaticivorans DSM 12444]|uniref:Cytochrome bd quinol oxidase subunit 2 apoprotein n=1 Tax=Novosphingobium aromaticivorans (strain ATCC 700278 / DSM 12444 / CCUG 56034 / CIP 105152 / NBRC 16084 / F199) TaxID=279238 RepID=Q2G9K2_NOVAD|nr:cytochrome d ubiquinol oxidase subunit II [Novosphingobium aromaticivorans]ABD25471.1 cytochrome bd quinol oxidase subunit 2 apoprotein [Novosphingobium aromaticivorans DSM 12444]SCX94678.1 cytochrome bd-I ubiquinol oxidase subunit 2 apoprotein [Novosphingobium aromaticivorans]